MKKHLKWIIPTICIVLAISLTGGIMYHRSHRVPTEIKYVHSDTDVNLNDPREVVGVSEYVFVGYVIETHDYFTEKDKRDFPESVKEYNNPCTECVVKVVKNIKGNLKEGETFSFYKMGGISEDRKYIELCEKDLMPEIGKYYIFTGGVNSDGAMTGGGENGTIELETNITEANLTDSVIYQKYFEAYKNEILPNLKGLYPDYLSVIDVNYGDGSYNRQLEEEYKRKLAEREAKEQAEQNTAESITDEVTTEEVTS